jgi:DNA repair photolyase
MMASHGCPFRCTYCFEHQSQLLYRGLGKVRRWLSVDRFLDELEYVKRNWDTRFFKFYDDVFPPFPSDAEVAWHQEFCRKYPARIGLPFHILTRCDLVIRLKERGVDALSDWKKAGLASITMSIESGNRFIRDHILVRDMSTRDITEAFQMAFDRGIPTFPNTIVGIPAPVLPRPDDPDFGEKLAKVAKDLEILRRINGSKINLEEIHRLIGDWLTKESQAREVIVEMLKSLGFRHSQLEYDSESVAFTLEQKPGFVEFPVLFPYPKTKAAQWCISRGDFDGNFEKLHVSYQTASPFGCYTENEKKILQNLALLGTFLALFTLSRSRLGRFLSRLLQELFIHRLTRITHPLATRFYLWLYTFSKAYMHHTRVYPMKYTLGEKLRFYMQMIKLDFWKQEKKRIGKT